MLRHVIHDCHVPLEQRPLHCSRNRRGRWRWLQAIVDQPKRTKTLQPRGRGLNGNRSGSHHQHLSHSCSLLHLGTPCWMPRSGVSPTPSGLSRGCLAPGPLSQVCHICVFIIACLGSINLLVVPRYSSGKIKGK